MVRSGPFALREAEGQVNLQQQQRVFYILRGIVGRRVPEGEQAADDYPGALGVPRGVQKLQLAEERPPAGPDHILRTQLLQQLREQRSRDAN